MVAEPNKSRRPRSKWLQLSLRSILAIMLAVAAYFAGYRAKIDAIRPLATSSLQINKDTARVPYHRYTLLRYQGDIIALHLLPDPQYGWEGVTYRWYRVTDGTDHFYTGSPLNADNKVNPNVKTGAGATYEGESSGGSGQIVLDDLSLQWSKSGLETGWLYFRGLPADIEVYPVGFDSLASFSGNLDPQRWRKFNKK